MPFRPVGKLCATCGSIIVSAICVPCRLKARKDLESKKSNLSAHRREELLKALDKNKRLSEKISLLQARLLKVTELIDEYRDIIHKITKEIK